MITPYQASSQQLQIRAEQTRLAEEVSALLQRSEDEQLTWRGTKTDLMEALYIAYETGIITDADGIIIPFRHLVATACRLLHCRAPRNPYELAARGRRRKGMQALPFLRRYRGKSITDFLRTEK